MIRCVKCKSKQVYELEFRMDYVHPRLIISLNPDIPEISERDLPDYLNLYYCKKCDDATICEECEK